MINERHIPFELDELQNLDLISFVRERRNDLTYENWKSIINEIFEKYSKNRQEFDKELFRSELAFLLEEVIETGIRNAEDKNDFYEDVKIFFRGKETLLKDLISDHNIKIGKRQPDLSESIEATVERYRVLHEVQEAFENVVEGIIVGGSMTYGPFFNVRSSRVEGETSSNIDMIMITTDDNFFGGDWSKFDESGLFDAEEKDDFYVRRGQFEEIKDREAYIFSQKFDIRGTDFDCSIHFFDPTTFEAMVGTRFVSNVSQGNEGVHTVKDFKAKPFSHAACNQQTFSGEIYHFDVPSQKKYQGGFITDLPLYIIKEGKLFPGIYQNIILPRCAVYFDKRGDVSRKVAEFRKSIVSYIKKEYKLAEDVSDDEIMEILLRSHMRNEVFPSTLKDNLYTTK